MNLVCGNDQELEQSAHRGRRGLLTIACAVASAAIAALALPAAGAAASAPTKPQQPNPQQLWRQYPLDAKPSGSPRASTGGSPRTTGGAGSRSRSQPKHSGSSGSGSVIPWFALLWAACLVVALAWSVALLRLLRRRASSPRQGKSTEPQSSAEEALREVVRATNSRPARSVEPRPSSDYAVLKLKQAVATADPAEELRKKAVIGVPLDAELRHEVDVLKAKRNGAEAVEACRIAWSPGDEESRFVAMTQTPGGKDAIISSSPPVRWHDPAPPPKNLPSAVRTHATLVHELKQAGWKTVGHGENWYSLELERRPTLAAREGEA
jgi:hypothetical protein